MTARKWSWLLAMRTFLGISEMTIYRVLPARSDAQSSRLARWCIRNEVAQFGPERRGRETPVGPTSSNAPAPARGRPGARHKETISRCTTKLAAQFDHARRRAKDASLGQFNPSRFLKRPDNQSRI